MIPYLHATFVDSRNGPVPIRSRSPLSRFIPLVVLMILATAISGASDEQRPPLKSGPLVGSEVTSFYVRAVTGPLAGKSVCYVCRNGDRPVVMVFLRAIDGDVTRLLKRLDALVNDHRADGLRCFAVLLSDSSQKDSARLQTLAFDEKLGIPLTMAGESMTGSNLSTISHEATVSVIMYDHRKVTQRFCYRDGECDEASCKSIIAAAEALAKESSE